MNNEIMEKLADIIDGCENNTESNWGSDYTWQGEFVFVVEELHELRELIKGEK